MSYTFTTPTHTDTNLFGQRSRIPRTPARPTISTETPPGRPAGTTEIFANPILGRRIDPIHQSAVSGTASLAQGLESMLGRSVSRTPPTGHRRSRSESPTERRRRPPSPHTPTGGPPPPGGTPPGPPGGPPPPPPPPPPGGIPVPTPQPPKIPKASTPTKFAGDRTKWQTFTIEAYMFFAHYPEFFHAFHGERNRCIYFLGWFEGETTRPWADAILGTIGTTKESPLLDDWTLLIQTAAELWGPINPEYEARAQLREIKQEQTVSAYHAKFMRWSIPSGYNREALVDFFYRGLKESIKNMMVNIQRPTTLEEMLSRALDYEARILERAAERRNETNRPRFDRNPKADHIIKATRLPQEERSKRMREGRCFTCNKTGHIARNCPDRQQIKAARTEVKEEEGSKKEEEDF